LRGDGDGNATKRAFEIAWDGGDTVWLSVDVDCVDTACVPGSGWPEPGRFLPCEVLKFLQTIADSKPVAGLQIVKCFPSYESAEIARLNSTRVIWDVLAWQRASAICRADTSREKYDWTRYNSLQITAFVATVTIPAE
jgi:agmatinase